MDDNGILDCPVCGECSSLFDVVDFNKSCAEAKGMFVAASGIPIYYARCGGCGFCFAPEMAKWSIAEFETKIYNSEYALFDPDYLGVRPRANAAQLEGILGRPPLSVRHLDYGGGNGILVDVLRGRGWNSISYDPFADREVRVEQLGQFDLITAFEVFEHVPNVQQMMAGLRELLSANGLILFSTLLSDEHIRPNERLTWWYASPRNGHVSLFSRTSLQILARNNGFIFGSFSANFHMLFSKIPEWAAKTIHVTYAGAPKPRTTQTGSPVSA